MLIVNLFLQNTLIKYSGHHYFHFCDIEVRSRLNLAIRGTMTSVASRTCFLSMGQFYRLRSRRNNDQTWICIWIWMIATTTTTKSPEPFNGDGKNLRVLTAADVKASADEVLTTSSLSYW